VDAEQTTATETPEERERLLRDLSADDGALVERCLAHHPAQTAAEAIAVLREFGGL
jgi:hypothetical protein